MRWIVLACCMLSGCVNYHNTHMPERERKPLDGRGPRDFPAAVDVNKTSTKAYAQLNAPAGVALKLRVACEGAAKVKARINARLAGESPCPLDIGIPTGIVQPDTPTIVELEADAPIAYRRIAIER